LSLVTVARSLRNPNRLPPEKKSADWMSMERRV
jgi:hypothetical protein